MKNIPFILVFSIFCRLTTTAQEKNAPDNLKHQATEMGAAFLKEDYKTFTHYSHPKIVTMMGGQEKMAGSLSQMIEGMKRKGMAFLNITFGEPSKLIKAGSEWQCTLPQHTEIQMPDGRIMVTSTLIAISTDNGRHWVFVDTSNKDIAAIKKVLPNISSAIVIPPSQPPVRL